MFDDGRCSRQLDYEEIASCSSSTTQSKMAIIASRLIAILSSIPRTGPTVGECEPRVTPRPASALVTFVPHPPVRSCQFACHHSFRGDASGTPDPRFYADDAAQHDNNLGPQNQSPLALQLASSRAAATTLET